MGCCCSRDDKKNERIRNRKGPMDTEKPRTESSISSAKEKSDKERKKTKIPEGPLRYIAMWDYEKTSDVELSFFKGDIFKDLSTEQNNAGADWIFVSLETKGVRGEKEKEKSSNVVVVGSTGYVPRKYVAVLGSREAEDCYFGYITRQDAEELLKGTPNGTFLIRAHFTQEFDDYALSISYRNQIRHYKLRDDEDDEGFHQFYLGEKKFDNIRDLVTHFQHRMTDDQTKKFLQQKKEIERTSEIPEKLYAFLVHCVDKSSDQRPAFFDIYSFLETYYKEESVDDQYCRILVQAYSPPRWRLKR